MDKATISVVAVCVIGIVCFFLGAAVGGSYVEDINRHNEKVEFMTACGNLKAEINRDHCTIMWYSRGAAH